MNRDGGAGHAQGARDTAASALLTLDLRDENDVLVARQRARQLARQLGFDTQDQARIATAVSELVRNVTQYAGGGRIEFALEGRAAPQALAIHVSDEGPGIADLELILSGRHQSQTGMGVGLVGARRLMDQFQVDTAPDKGTTVHLRKFLPRGLPALDPAAVRDLVGNLAREGLQGPLAEVRHHNQELLAALDGGREAENRARRVTAWWQMTFDAISDGVMLLDRNAKIVRANKAMADLFGTTPEALVGRSGMPALPGAAEPREGWPARRALRDRTRTAAEVVVGQRWFEIVADPVIEETGEVSAVVRTIKDITERRHAQARMEELLNREQAARQEAEQVNRVKDEFLATLSHELRTPLNAIVGWTHVLRAGGLDAPTAMRAIETIARNANLQAQLISDILDVSSIVAGKLRLDPQAVDLAEVIGEVLETVKPAASAKGIRLEPRLDPAAGPITGDPHRLQQVVWNLLSNAIKFTPREGRVQVGLEATDSSIVLTVEDNGPGIDPSFFPHVFERFRQADSSSTRPHGGLGLGLAIVRHLVELHGGTVEARNRAEGHGAILRVTLPRRRVSEAEAGAPMAQAPASPADDPAWMDEAPSLADTTVLVVDDDGDARTLIQYMLECCGARVRTAASAPEGLRVMQEWQPDVLLADIEMPIEDGYSLIGKVRALPAAGGGSTPAAALTGYASTQDRMKALQAGFQSHVAKPVQPAELATVVATLKSTTVRRG